MQLRLERLCTLWAQLDRDLTRHLRWDLGPIPNRQARRKLEVRLTRTLDKFECGARTTPP
jgi:hypothetical protein